MTSIQFFNWLPMLLHGLEVTVFASLVAICTSVIFGCLMASLRALNIKPLTILVQVYTSVFRNTPLLVVMFFLFYGLPMINIHVPGIVCGIIAVTLNEGAFVAEILRGAIKNIKKGEIEAAESLGLTNVQIVRHITFPLAIRASIPMILGQSSIMIKDTSLFSMIMIIDLTGAASNFYSNYFNASSIWIVGLIYIGLFLIYTVIGRFIEKRIKVIR